MRVITGLPLSSLFASADESASKRAYENCTGAAWREGRGGGWTTAMRDGWREAWETRVWIERRSTRSIAYDFNKPQMTSLCVLFVR